MLGKIVSIHNLLIILWLVHENYRFMFKVVIYDESLYNKSSRLLNHS